MTRGRGRPKPKTPASPSKIIVPVTAKAGPARPPNAADRLTDTQKMELVAAGAKLEQVQDRMLKRGRELVELREKHKETGLALVPVTLTGKEYEELVQDLYHVWGRVAGDADAIVLMGVIVSAAEQVVKHGPRTELLAYLRQAVEDPRAVLAQQRAERARAGTAEDPGATGAAQA